MKGRMMVITTNHPEKLDKALVRPGRVDLNIKFGRSKMKEIIEMYNCFYHDNKLDNVPENLDDKWTAAEVAQVFINNMDNPKAAFESLCRSAEEEKDLEAETVKTLRSD